jgi:hypothetical protein
MWESRCELYLMGMKNQQMWGSELVAESSVE